MQKNYWQEYWDSYWNFMAMYLRELQKVYPNADIKSEYMEVADLFEPTMEYENLDDYNNYMQQNNNQQFTSPNNEGQNTNQSISPNNSEQFIYPSVPNNNTGQNTNSPMNQGESIYPNGSSNNEGQNTNQSISPNSGQNIEPFILPGSIPFISPGGGQFTINNCRRMAIVRIVMRRGFNPSEFFMAVDRADNRSIQGFRMDCQGGRIRFVPMAVEYRNINLIECAI